MKRTEAISNFLNASTHADLASLYGPNMEVQVNVAQDGGDRVVENTSEGFQGRGSLIWTDGLTRWYSFRIPKNARTIPEENDFDIKFDIAAHAEGIGMTGWDWVNKVSRWVAFDFDAISGHSEKNPKKLTTEELDAVKQAACNIPWVTVRKSTGGKGLHLYVKLDHVRTENHTEHAALGRSILGMMSALTGFDFSSKVDVCGGNMWVWHRKMQGTFGLTLIKEGEVLDDVPINWRDHIQVVSGKRRKNLPQFIPEQEKDAFEELTGQRPHVPLDPEHKRLIEFLKETNAQWWWDQDHHMLVCHSYDLKIAHQKLGMRGIFETLATGRDHGADHNSFCHPLRYPSGAWVVRRYTPGIQEAKCWDQDTNGWTRCYLNREPTLETSSRMFGGIEQEHGGFVFNEAETAMTAAGGVGANMDLPNWAMHRQTILKTHKDGRLVVHVKRESMDKANEMAGWLEDKGWWKKIFNAKLNQPDEPEVANYDDVVRHLITEGDEDYGWCIRSSKIWQVEPLNHVRVVLKALNIRPKDIEIILGNAVMQAWTIVNKPFQPEYPGNRQWNHKGAQFRFAPNPEQDGLNYPTWMKILNHCGSGLDSAVSEDGWCKANGIVTGGEYLKIWVASLFQQPDQPLPYLFFYGPQNSGKSIFHEALGMLITRGYARADAALISQSAFNGELEHAVLCVVEETNLQASKSAYNRIKDWVTARQLSIHIKGETPYHIDNMTHWVQTANNYDYCPMFPGDTRITMCYVGSLDPMELIPKKDLEIMLEKEAPDFLSAILNLELPSSHDRLNVPVITTDDKKLTERLNRTPLQAFIDDECHYNSGEIIKFSEFYDRFVESLEPGEVHVWSKIRVGKELPPEYPRGRVMQLGAQFYIGNISWTAPDSKEMKPKMVLRGEKLVPER